MTANKLAQASAKAHSIDQETQVVFEAVKRKNNKAITWFIVSWTILFGLAIFGLYKQNLIATQNKQHIDCIIKDLATPQKVGTQHKYIDRLNTDCNIKFTP